MGEISELLCVGDGFTLPRASSWGRNTPSTPWVPRVRQSRSVESPARGLVPTEAEAVAGGRGAPGCVGGDPGSSSGSQERSCFKSSAQTYPVAQPLTGACLTERKTSGTGVPSGVTCHCPWLDTVPASVSEWARRDTRVRWNKTGTSADTHSGRPDFETVLVSAGSRARARVM